MRFLLVIFAFGLLTPLAAIAGARSYTHHPPSKASPEIVVLQVDGFFAAQDGAKVLEAIAEWNHALNGQVRFDVVAADGGRARAWTIRPERGGRPEAPDGSGQPLSFTQAGFAGIGGRMIIYVDRIGVRDLRGVALHELGHVLGLDHDPRGNLMGARYSPTIEQCVDKPTMESVAALRHLRLDALNWCEAPAQN